MLYFHHGKLLFHVTKKKRKSFFAVQLWIHEYDNILFVVKGEEIIIETRNIISSILGIFNSTIPTPSWYDCA